jgi:hypothetical protein
MGVVLQHQISRFYRISGIIQDGEKDTVERDDECIRGPCPNLSYLHIAGYGDSRMQLIALMKLPK